MEANVTVILTDTRGWQKTYDLTEGAYWVGSAPAAYIQLADIPDLPPYFLQIVNMQRDAAVRVVNLSAQEINYTKGPVSAVLTPRQCLDVYGPEVLQIHGYSLQFKLHKQVLAQPSASEMRQRVIGVRLVLSDVVLRPNGSITGGLSLQNLGKQACQYKIEVEGLPPDCLELSPPPLIHPGGEESTQFRIYHRQTYPKAGQCHLVFRISAPTVYPGEEVTLRQIIQVMPVYAHTLALDVPVPAAPPPEAAPLPAPQPEAAFSEALPAAAREPEWVEDAAQEQAALPKPALPARKNRTLRPPATSDEKPLPADPLPVPFAITAQSPEPDLPSKGGSMLPSPSLEPPPDAILSPQPLEPESAAPVDFLLPMVDLTMTPLETVPQAVSPVLVSELPLPEPIPELSPPTPLEPPPPAPSPDQTLNTASQPAARRPRRPDLSGVKVMQANSGDFLEKRTGQE